MHCIYVIKYHKTEIEYILVWTCVNIMVNMELWIILYYLFVSVGLLLIFLLNICLEVSLFQKKKKIFV